MSTRSRVTRLAPVLAVAGLGAALPSAASAAEQIYAVTDQNRLVSVQSDSPSALRTNLAISGLTAGETLVGLDVRPATDQLYGLGSQGRLYVVNRTTGNARVVGTGAPFAPAPNGTGFGFDFNPTVDRIRLVSDAEQDLRLDPNTGATAGVDGNLAYVAGDRNAGRDPAVTASAYTNSAIGAATTTLYGIDTNTDSLVIQNPPNAGALGSVGAAPGLGVNVEGPAAFDILAQGNVGYAFLKRTDSARSFLYRIDLATGRAAPAADNPAIGLVDERTVGAMAITGQVADDNTAPRFSVASSSTQLRSRLLARGLELTVACDETCSFSAELFAGTSREGTANGSVETVGQDRVAIRLDSEARA
ncbi:MAG: DUF4394 domain-containing protein, partial [Solirubrobacterales bacterium]|nr:DUF4394 domain-containing protein [Solirubrobacterales bacterium]